MTTVSTSLSPFITLVEGSTPASPAAGQQRVFIDSADHKEKRVNSSGTVVNIEAGGGGGYAPSFTSKTTNYTLTTSDTGIAGDATGGSITITLPTAVGNTNRFTILKKDSSVNTVTIATTSAQTINGASTVVLSAQNASIEVMSDGANWREVAAMPVGGGSSGAMTELGDVVVSGGSTTTMSFTSISGAYTSLLLSLTGRCDEVTVDDYLLLRFNADTGNNYESQIIVGQNTGASGSRTAATSAITRLIDVPGSSAPANMPGGGQIFIPHYVDTTFYKLATAFGGMSYGTNTPESFQGMGIWKNTAAITRIDIVAPASSNWVAGSHARLFGVN